MRIFLILLMLSGFTPTAWAAVLHLKDGYTIEGTIIERNNKSIKMNIDGTLLTYYVDEIQDIDGQPFAATQAGPSAVSATPTAPESPAVNADKKALILKLMEITNIREGMMESFKFMKENLSEVMKKNFPEAGAGVGIIVDKIFDMDKIFNADEMLETLIPIYDRNLSAEELQGLINFYGSDVGHKLILVSPVINKEVMRYSIDYAMKSFAAQQAGQSTVSAAPAATQPPVVNADKKALILKFMEVAGGSGKDMDMMAKSFPPQTAQLMKNKAFRDGIKEEMIATYDRNLSTEDLQSLINFYESDIGRQYVLALPIIMKESMQASQGYMKSKLQANPDYMKNIISSVQNQQYEKNQTP